MLAKALRKAQRKSFAKVLIAMPNGVDGADPVRVLTVVARNVDDFAGTGARVLNPLNNGEWQRKCDPANLCLGCSQVDLMVRDKTKVQTQQEFLREAMQSLGLTRCAFAARISVPEKTLNKWLAPVDTGDYRNMPDVVWAYVREILVWDKKGG